MEDEEKKSKIKRARGVLGKLYEIYDFLSNFFPGGAPTLLLIGGLIAGGYAGYALGFDAGAGSVEVPQCEVCEECEVCPEPVDCPRPVESYTCEELDAVRSDCLCLPL